MAQRKNIPEAVETEVLTNSKRRCCLCFALQKDLSVKKGQIAHLDHNPANNKLDNLAFLCLDHHDQYDIKTSQAKGLKLAEVKQYRADLIAYLASGGSVSGERPSVVSYQQQGGITAGTVNISAVPEPELHHRVLFENRQQGEFFHSQIELVVDSPYPPANLYLEVRAPSIVDMELIPQRAGLSFSGHTGTREGWAFTNLPQPSGTLHLKVRMRSAEAIELIYRFK